LLPEAITDHCSSAADDDARKLLQVASVDRTVASGAPRVSTNKKRRRLAPFGVRIDKPDGRCGPSASSFAYCA